MRGALLFIGLAAVAQDVNTDAEWKRLRARLLAEESYIDELRGGALPVTEGYIVAFEPTQRPHTLLIGIETPLVAELKLQILRDGQHARLTATPSRNARVSFRSAQVAGFTRRPFLVTATIDESGIDYFEAPGAQ